MVQNSAAKPRANKRPHNPARRRGRPRAFEPEVALTQAMDLFWKEGFAATSLDELSAATGLNRPSLYGAFGDKRALYLQAYRRYREHVRESFAPLFAELAGMSHRKMAAELNARKLPTPGGGQWHAVTVKRVLSRLG